MTSAHQQHSQARIDRVRALAGAGLSMSKIGARMGMTRSAICSVVRRLKRKGLVRPQQQQRCKPVIVRLPIIPFELATDSAVSLLELSDDRCHWPVGPGTGHVAQLFCNASRDGSFHVSYCKRHALRSVEVDDTAACVRPKMMAG